MTKKRIGFIAMIGAACMAWPALAHHSFAMFDRTKVVTVSGVVKDFDFESPHSWLWVVVKNPDKTTTTWGFETEGPYVLERWGIRKGTFPAGSKVTVYTNPLRDGRPAGNFLKVVEEDGSVWTPRGREVAGQAPSAP
jgi:hypothetical protein